MNTLSSKVIGWLSEQVKPKKQPVLIVIPTGKLLEKFLNQLWEGTGHD